MHRIFMYNLMKSIFLHRKRQFSSSLCYVLEILTCKIDLYIFLFTQKEAANQCFSAKFSMQKNLYQVLNSKKILLIILLEKFEHWGLLFLFDNRLHIVHILLAPVSYREHVLDNLEKNISRIRIDKSGAIRLSNRRDRTQHKMDIYIYF